MKVILVTGACGFIASNFVRKLLKTSRYFVINVDKLNYCGTHLNIEKEYNFETHCSEKTDLTNYVFYKADINNAEFISDILRRHKVDVIYHFAAQSHVDVSFGNSLQFVIDNVMGTSTLLECARVYGKLERFIYVSSDEVYGSVTEDKDEVVLKYGLYNATNPYAATKAAAELMVKSYHISYKLPTIITRSNNVYGYGQFWEKLIPKSIYNLQKGKKIPIYGDGSAKRKYLFVEDACDAYLTIMEKGQIGQIYEMESHNEYTALEMAHKFISILKPNDPLEQWINHVVDRAFHDSRYIVNPQTLSELGWSAQTPFDNGLAKTVEWYVNYAIPESHWSYSGEHMITKI
uniref:NAD(P)-binding domain-containing protein n=1 Tax=viral metagenome TaxID=1070528 RepID=A0A6C0BMX9_9ZZZZ